MFSDWVEYRDYLADNLITNEESRAAFRKRFAKIDKKYTHERIRTDYAKVCITAIFKNDLFMTVIDNFEYSPDVRLYRQWLKGKKIPTPNKYIPQ